MQNEEHLCLIAVIGEEEPDKRATGERGGKEKRNGDSRVWSGLEVGMIQGTERLWKWSLSESAGGATFVLGFRFSE